MFILNIANPFTLFLIVLAVALLIFLGQEIKKSIAVAIPLFAFLILLVIHVAQVATLSAEFADLAGTLYKCIALDFLFILITFFAYLWIDDSEAKANNIKSIDNSLDWFWKEI
jgi:Na+/citrate or Na+/malate symporter